MPLDVLDDDDGVVDHEPDREHDGEQRQQVQREPEDLHQEDGADERHRDGHERHEHRAERAEEEEDDDDDDERPSRPACARTSWMALSMYLVASKATVACMPVGSSFWMMSISLRTRSMTSSELAFGSTQTPMKTAVSPEKRTSWS